jgi:hypothetical protein
MWCVPIPQQCPLVVGQRVRPLRSHKPHKSKHDRSHACVGPCPGRHRRSRPYALNVQRGRHADPPRRRGDSVWGSQGQCARNDPSILQSHLMSSTVIKAKGRAPLPPASQPPLPAPPTRPRHTPLNSELSQLATKAFRACLSRARVAHALLRVRTLVRTRASRRCNETIRFLQKFVCGPPSAGCVLNNSRGLGDLSL